MIQETWAVVVNWNGGEDNLACVASLVEQGLPEERIVFVDNASSDGSADLVERRFPGVPVLRNERNLGYGHGTNRGLELALESGAAFCYLVNNDVTHPPGTLPRLLEEMREPGLGIVGPRVLYDEPRDRVWCAGGLMTYRQNLSVMLGHGKPDGPEFQRTRDVDYVPGCAMLVRRSVFERIGLLQGEYFAYHEDVEFCLLAKQAGFGVRVVGEVPTFHAAHSSTGGGYNARRKYMMGVNTVWFLRRNGTPLRWISFWIFDVLTLPVVWLVRALRGEGAGVLAKARGTVDGLRGKRVEAGMLERLTGGKRG